MYRNTNHSPQVSFPDFCSHTQCCKRSEVMRLLSPFLCLPPLYLCNAMPNAQLELLFFGMYSPLCMSFSLLYLGLHEVPGAVHRGRRQGLG